MKITVLIFSMMISVASVAAGPNVSAISNSESTHNYLLPQGWSEYFGVTTGLMDQPDEQHPTGGQPNSLKVIGSHAIKDSRWVGDAGLGWQFHTLNQSSRDYSMINSGVVELGARYQLATKWEVGGTFDTFIANRDKYGATDWYAMFIGPTVMRDFVFHDTDMRFGISLLRDINIDNEDVNIIMASLHIRFGGQRDIVNHKVKSKKVVSNF
jgi:hypothetical protein